MNTSPSNLTFIHNPSPQFRSPRWEPPQLPDAETVTKFSDLVRTTLRGNKLGERYAAICAEEEQAAEE